MPFEERMNRLRTTDGVARTMNRYQIRVVSVVEWNRPTRRSCQRIKRTMLGKRGFGHVFVPGLSLLGASNFAAVPRRTAGFDFDRAMRLFDVFATDWQVLRPSGGESFRPPMLRVTVLLAIVR